MPLYMTTGLTFGGRTYHEAPRYVVYSSLHVHPASSSSPHSKRPSTRTNLRHVFSLRLLHNKQEDILYRPMAGVLRICGLFGFSCVPMWSISVCHKCLQVATFLQDFLAILCWSSRDTTARSCPLLSLSTISVTAAVYCNAVQVQYIHKSSDTSCPALSFCILRTAIGNKKNKSVTSHGRSQVQTLSLSTTVTSVDVWTWPGYSIWLTDWLPN